MAEEPTPVTGELQALTQLRDAARARLLQMALEVAGIQAWLATVNLAEVSPGLGVALGIDVLVRDADFGVARELIAEVESGAIALPLDPVSCPHCRSDDTRYVGRPDRAGALLGTFLVGLPRPDVVWAWRCGGCDEEWR
jgi:hypothetical protein